MELKYSNVCCLSNAELSQDPSRPACRKICVQEHREAGRGGGGWKNPEGMCDSGRALGLPEFRKYLLGDTGRKKLCLGHMKERLEAGSGRLGAKIWTGQSRAIQNARGDQWVTMETPEVASGSLWPYSFCCLQYKEWNLEANTHHTSAPPQA